MKKTILLATVLLLAAPGLLRGQEDDDAGGKKKSGFWERFRLGATVNFLSGVDSITSNSGNLVTLRDISINDGSIRFEPRVTDGRITLSPIASGQTINFFSTVTFIRDPRKDIGVLRETELEETLWLNVNAAYDVKSWRHGTLFMQFDAGYYKGDIGRLEVAVDIAEEAVLNPADQDVTADDPFANYQFIYPTVGTLTQMPVSLSGLWQFRPRSPFRPYVGLGVGYISASLDSSESLALVNQQLSGIPYEWNVRGQTFSQGVLPAETITTTVHSDLMYLAKGGLEYNINRNWSVYMAAEFVSTPAHVEIRSLGQFPLFGIGIAKNDAVSDIPGIGTAEGLISLILSLPVEEAVMLITDVTDRAPGAGNPDNERAFFTSFPVTIGDPVTIIVPNPVNPNVPTPVERQSKMFIHGGDVQFDAYSMGIGFRYRY